MPTAPLWRESHADWNTPEAALNDVDQEERASSRGAAISEPSTWAEVQPSAGAREEREVVALVAHGLSNDETAGAMTLSSSTAKTHVSRAMI
jgi:ATP/maltotriose-dependent transcriptional regulator MalT